LQKLSKATGINIVTNTGYYGAVHHKYLPNMHLKNQQHKSQKYGLMNSGMALMVQP
jgi:predicted metal-dependent phosphotriesterase family hydrolase